MKKFFLILGCIVVLLFVAAGIFLATFNINRYKPLLAREIEKKLNTRVELGNLSLGFGNGLAAKLGFLKSPFLSVGASTFNLEIGPLLRKEIRISSVQISNPDVKIIKKADGSLNIGGFETGTTASAPSVSAPSSPGPAANIAIKSVKISNAHVVYEDQSVTPVRSFEIKDIDVTVQNFALDKSFPFLVKAAVYSIGGQNVQVQGQMSLPSGGQKGSLQNVLIQTSLGELDLKQLAAILPQANAPQLPAQLAGEIEANIQRLDLDPGLLNQSSVELKLRDGLIRMPRLKSALEKITLDSEWKQGTLNVRQLRADFAGGHLQMEGAAQNIFQNAALSFHSFFRDIVIGELLQNAAPNAPRLEGHLTVELQGQAQGITWESVSHTLNGNGRILLKDGVVSNFNLLREVIQKISIIPGAETVIQNNFPKAYERSLQENNTLLQPIDQPVEIRNGIFVFNPLLLRTDVMVMQGAGQVGLDKSLIADANLFMNAEISAALAGIVRPLQSLMNERGEILIPVHIEGVLPGVRLLPDGQYLAARLLGGGTQNLLQNLLKPSSEQTETAPSDSKLGKFGGFLQQLTGESK